MWIQIYVTKETSANCATDQTIPEDGLEKIANFMRRKDRKFYEKQKPFSPKMYIGSAETHDCLHFCAYVCFHLISNVHIVRTFENTIPFQTLEKWHNVSYRYVKSETSDICRTGAWLLKPVWEKVEKNDIYYLVKPNSTDKTRTVNRGCNMLPNFFGKLTLRAKFRTLH